MEEILDVAHYSPIVNGEGVKVKGKGNNFLFIAGAVLIVLTVVVVTLEANKKTGENNR